MPTFRREGDVQFCSLITGPSHVELGLELHDGSEPAVHVECRDLGRACGCRAPAKDVIVQAVDDGLTLASSKSGRRYRPRTMIYFTDDSNRPDMYMRIAHLIAMEYDKSK